MLNSIIRRVLLGGFICTIAFLFFGTSTPVAAQCGRTPEGIPIPCPQQQPQVPPVLPPGQQPPVESGAEPLKKPEIKEVATATPSPTPMPHVRCREVPVINYFTATNANGNLTQGATVILGTEITFSWSVSNATWTYLGAREYYYDKTGKTPKSSWIGSVLPPDDAIKHPVNSATQYIHEYSAHTNVTHIQYVLVAGCGDTVVQSGLLFKVESSTNNIIVIYPQPIEFLFPPIPPEEKVSLSEPPASAFDNLPSEVAGPEPTPFQPILLIGLGVLGLLAAVGIIINAGKIKKKG